MGGRGFCQYFCLFLKDYLILFGVEKLNELLLVQGQQMVVKSEG
jgi:hypothetical protein